MKKLLLILFCLPMIGFGQYNLDDSNLNVFGFSTSNTFTYCNVEDISFVNCVKRINPRILRFPGGAVGNFYHFGGYGYGFDFNEIDAFHNGKFPKRSRGLEESRRKKNHQHDYIEDFISLSKALGAKAVLVANPFILTNDIILMIEKLKDNNIEVVGVELGSELSNRSYYEKGYTIKDYIRFANECSNMIKKKFPKMLTAVVAAPLGKRRGHRHDLWNKELAKYDFYDAVIIHSYAKVIKGQDQYGQMISEFNEKENKEDQFNLYKQRALQYLTVDYPKEVKEYSNLFKKPIWVTEWNLQMSKTTGNTFFQSLFVANFLLEVVSNYDLSNIKLTTYHNLGGRDLSGSIFMNQDSTVEIHSTYYPMIMIEEVFGDEFLIIEKKIIDQLFMYKFINRKNNDVIIYTLDWSEKTIKKTYSNVEKDNISTEIIFYSSNLYDIANNEGMFQLDTITQ